MPKLTYMLAETHRPGDKQTGKNKVSGTLSFQVLKHVCFYVWSYVNTRTLFRLWSLEQPMESATEGLNKLNKAQAHLLHMLRPLLE